MVPSYVLDRMFTQRQSPVKRTKGSLEGTTLSHVSPLFPSCVTPVTGQFMIHPAFTIDQSACKLCTVQVFGHKVCTCIGHMAEDIRRRASGGILQRHNATAVFHHIPRGVPPISQIPQMRYGWRRRAQGAPSGKNKKKLERAFAAREGLWTEVRECGGGGIEVRGGPGTARGGPDTVRGRNICRNICDI